MPALGRPTAASSLQKVAMGRPASAGETAREPATAGGALGGMEGVRGPVEFVDPGTHNQIGKDGFLRLLTHQLSNQDPLQPMDQKQIAADLAQFSQLEQLAQLNAKMDAVGAGSAGGGDRLYGANLLGKEVVTAGSSIDHDGESDRVELPFHLDRDAQRVVASVVDGEGRTVARSAAGQAQKGPGSLFWDGLMDDGTKAPPGNYSFTVTAQDMGGRDFPGETDASGTVTGVRFDDGEVVLVVGDGRKVFLRDVVSLRLPKAPAAAAASQGYGSPPAPDASDAP